MKTMHLFAGVGGGLLADLILGHEPIIAVEWDRYACQVLRERAREGWFPSLQVWEGDVRMFDPSEYTGRVGCIHAGFPCQDISVAGKQAGVSEGTRSGLYREVLRIGSIVKPRFLFLENVSAILSNGLGTVLADLASMGYDSRWMCIRASDVGAPHHRDRWFLLATNADSSYGSAKQEREHQGAEESCGSSAGEMESLVADSRHSRVCKRRQSSDAIEEMRLGTGIHCDGLSGVCKQKTKALAYTESEFSNGINDHPRELLELGEVSESGNCGWSEDVADSYSAQCQGNERSERSESEYTDTSCGSWWNIEPGLGRVANGVPNRVGQLKGYGNAQVPLQAAVAYRLLGGI